jgi:HEAT repeat protein
MVSYLNRTPQADLTPFQEYLSGLDADSLGPMTAMLGELEHHYARRMVYTLLGERGGEAIDLVGSHVYDRRWYVARNVAMILGRINQPRTIAFLKKAVKHEDARVRKEALKALASLPQSEAHQLLLNFLNDPDPSLRLQACKSITATSTGAAPKLQERAQDPALADEDPRLQKEILAAYARCDSVQAEETLLALIKKKTMFNKQKWSQVRINAVYALGELSTPDAETHLEHLRQHGETSLRTPAAQALELRRRNAQPREQS